MMRSVRRAGESARMSSQAAPAAHSSFYMAMRMLPAPEREAMFAIYAFCRAVDDIADEPGPRPRRAPGRAGALARRRRRAVRRSRAPPHLAALDRGGAALRSEAGGFPRRHRRHGDGRRTRTSARPTGRRSTSIATGWRAPSAGCRCASSAWRPNPAWRWPTISAARCSSPTSCATSTRTRASAGSTCRARRSPPRG